MKLFTLFLMMTLALVYVKSRLFSFRAQTASDYAGLGPAISLREHLNGEILSEGLIYGPNGRVTNSFVAKMVGQWDGNKGTLSEAFTYSNGKQQNRKWFLTMGNDNRFTATADDIVDSARKIQHVFRWKFFGGDGSSSEHDRQGSIDAFKVTRQ